MLNCAKLADTRIISTLYTRSRGLWSRGSADGSAYSAGRVRSSDIVPTPGFCTTHFGVYDRSLDDDILYWSERGGLEASDEGFQPAISYNFVPNL